MNELSKRNAELRHQVEVFRDRQVADQHAKSPPRLCDYPLPVLKRRIADALSERCGKGRLELQLELIDRETFGGDLALKIPQLVADGGLKEFIKIHVPWITGILTSERFADAIAEVRTKGMYINLTLSGRWMLTSAQVIADMGDRFGES